MSRIRGVRRQFADERSRRRTHDLRRSPGRIMARTDLAPCVRVDDADRMMSGGFAFVAVVQTADFGQLDDVALARWLHGSWIGGVLVQGEVGARPVIVRDIPAQNSVEMLFTKHDHVVQAFAPC